MDKRSSPTLAVFQTERADHGKIIVIGPKNNQLGEMRWTETETSSARELSRVTTDYDPNDVTTQLAPTSECCERLAALEAYATTNRKANREV